MGFLLKLNMIANKVRCPFPVTGPGWDPIHSFADINLWSYHLFYD